MQKDIDDLLAMIPRYEENYKRKMSYEELVKFIAYRRGIKTETAEEWAKDLERMGKITLASGRVELMK